MDNEKPKQIEYTDATVPYDTHYSFKSRNGKQVTFEIVGLNIHKAQIDPDDNLFEQNRLIKMLMIKELFCNALSRMPKDYVTRLVFNTYHDTACLFEYPPDPGCSPLAAAICYRRFLKEHFVEIAFCAVSTEKHYSGYGHVIMGLLKEHVKRIGITDIVTYADNNAVEYFSKQGFSKAIVMPKSVWFGRVKHYESATLMQCQLWNVDYIKFNDIVRMQREAILQRLGIKYIKLKDIQAKTEEIKKGLNEAKKDIENENENENLNDCDKKENILKIALESDPSIKKLISITKALNEKEQKNNDSVESFEEINSIIQVADDDEVNRCNNAAQYAITIESGKEYALPFLTEYETVSKISPIEGKPYWQPLIVPNNLTEMSRKARNHEYRTPNIFREHARSIYLKAQSFYGDVCDKTVMSSMLSKGLWNEFCYAYQYRLTLDDAIYNYNSKLMTLDQQSRMNKEFML